MIRCHSRSRSRSREKQLRPQERCQDNLQQIKKVFMDTKYKCRGCQKVSLNKSNIYKIISFFCS
ncbi:unnamed protein product [Paramecium sonneborni]|uniref:Uncharacterized protein n=1 Tax=Paramecium sonneborni TaxID=65129 RepID=A0A8S1QTI1_9CILI|nr:unnamed protein product [Paramecium sonneborni]